VDEEGSIALGELDLWTFNAIAGVKITLQVTKLTGGAGFAPRMEVFTPEGHRKAFRQDALTAMVDFATESSGSYTVVVSDGIGTGSGTYRLRLSRSTLEPGLNPLVIGSTLSGEIATAGEEDRYTFTASTERA
jgi:hypothetical protein